MEHIILVEYKDNTERFFRCDTIKERNGILKELSDNKLVEYDSILEAQIEHLWSDAR